MVDQAGADAGANDAEIETDSGNRGPSDEEKEVMALVSAQKRVDKARAHLADAEQHLQECGG